MNTISKETFDYMDGTSNLQAQEQLLKAANTIMADLIHEGFDSQDVLVFLATKIKKHFK